MENGSEAYESRFAGGIEEMSAAWVELSLKFRVPKLPNYEKFIFRRTRLPEVCGVQTPSLHAEASAISALSHRRQCGEIARIES